MSDSFIYHNARIKSMEPKLMSSQQLQRLLECSSADEAFKLITELGYGAGLNSEFGDFEPIFLKEEQNAVDILRDCNVDGALDAFLLIYDYHNLKALLKAKIKGDAHPVLMPAGIYDPDTIKDGINGSALILREGMKKVLDTIERLIAEDKASPHAIDYITDKEMYRDILASIRKSGKAAEKYFTMKIDFSNILSFIRCKRLDLDEKFFTESFIEGGELDREFFLSVFQSPIDSMLAKCKFTSYGDIATKFAEHGSVAAFEAEADDRLLRMWKTEAGDMFSAAPVISFYISKLTELKIVKLVVAGIKNNVDRALIKERMRELYA